jgi:hypothetical protein
MALTQKCGKVSELVKSKGVWWDSETKEHDREEVLSALIDVFKFVLVAGLKDDDLVPNFTLWNTFWERGMATKPDALFFYEFVDIPSDVANYGFLEPLDSIVKMARYCGITREQFETSYLKLWEANMIRFSKEDSSDV